MVVVERYPDLKADQQFLTLQAQLEGTENRIAVARRDYIEAVRQFNTEIRTFPGVIRSKLLYPIWKPNPPSAPSPVPMRRPRSLPMNVMRRWLALCLLLCATALHAAPDFPALTGRVVDEANLMSRKQAHQLAQQLAVFEKRSGVQLVVVSIDTLAGDTIEEYGYQLGRHWGIGQKGVVNGVLLIIRRARQSASRWVMA
jgi:hypothetical protein